MATPLDLKISPVALSCLTGLLMWLVATNWPAAAIQLPYAPPAGLLAAAAGITICMLAVVRFRRHRTTVLPFRPAAATALVTDGVYRFTRNPMYLGMLLVLAGWGLWLEHAGALLLLPPYVLWLHWFQILPEERAMTARFGDDYRAYQRNVRRWV